MEVLTPCCLNRMPCCDDFTKILELPHSGLIIYKYAKKYDQKTTVFGRDDGSIILHNTNSRDLIKPDYISELCRYQTKCNKCKALIQSIRSLLDEISIIKGNQTIAICDRCKKATTSNQCRKCDFIVSKFVAGNEKKIEKRQKRFKAWLLKVKILLQSILNAQSICKHEVYKDNELERILKELKVPLYTSIRIPDIEFFPNIHEDQLMNQSITESKEMLELLLSRIQSEGLEKLQTSYNSLKPSLKEPCICKLLKEGQFLENEILEFSIERTGASSLDTPKMKSKVGELATLSKNVHEGIQKTSSDILEKSKQVIKDTQNMAEWSEPVLDKAKRLPIESPSKQLKDSHKERVKALRKNVASTFIKSEKTSSQCVTFKTPEDRRKEANKALPQTVLKDKTRSGMAKIPGTLNKVRIKEPVKDSSYKKIYVKEAQRKVQDEKHDKVEAQIRKDAKKIRASLLKRLQGEENEAGAKRKKDTKQAKNENTEKEIKGAKKDKYGTSARYENTAEETKVKENAKEAKRKKYVNEAGKDNNTKKANRLIDENGGKKAKGKNDTKEAKVRNGEKKEHEATNEKEWKDSTQAKPAKDAKEGAVKQIKYNNIEKENVTPRGNNETQSEEKSTRQSTTRIKLKLKAMPTESEDELHNLMKEKNSLREKMDRKKSESRYKELEAIKLKALADFAALPVIKFTTIAPSCNTSQNVSEADIRSNISQYIVKGNFIERYLPRHKEEHDSGAQHPVFFKKEFGLGGLEETSALTPEAKTNEVVRGAGVIKYRLSDKEFIDKGWTKLPTKKIMRRMNIYKMEPANPQYDWFERHKDQKMLFYDTGEKLADIDVDGRGVWYYKNGNLALEYYNAEELHAGQRYIVYSCTDECEFGRPKPRTVLGLFDFLGNGVIYDSNGNVRLKYNQSEGVIIDPKIGPPSRWKWHTLNEPPVLQQVFVNTRLSEIDPHIVKLDSKRTEEVDMITKQAQADMLQVELDNFVKEKSQKLMQKFKPFQIRMKAAKLNKNFSIKILDQSNIYLMFRNGQTSLKLNLGMNLISHEIVHTDISEAADVSTPYDKYPAKTGSVTNIQHLLSNIKKHNRSTQSKPPISAEERISRILY